MKYDFWYSEKQKHCLDYIFPPVDKPDTFIDGKEYTCVIKEYEIICISYNQIKC